LELKQFKNRTFLDHIPSSAKACLLQDYPENFSKYGIAQKIYFTKI